MCEWLTDKWKDLLELLFAARKLSKVQLYGSSSSWCSLVIFTSSIQFHDPNIESLFLRPSTYHLAVAVSVACV